MPLRFDLTRRVRGASLRLVVFTEYLDATYYAYFHYVLDSLADEGHVAFHVISSKTATRYWRSPSVIAPIVALLVRPHLIVFNRYALPWGTELVRRFRRRGVAVLYHIDDDLLAIPPELGASVSAHHGDAKIVRAREEMLTVVDRVQPSTEPLAQRLRARLGVAKVLTPSHPPYLASLLGADDVPGPDEASPVVGYMASKSHPRDLDLVRPAIVSLLDARRDVRFEIFGTLAMPPELERRFPGRVHRHEAIGDYREFLRRLAALRWSVGLAPLLPTAFNACKSAIKYFEYTACRIPTVASAVPSFGVIDAGRNGLIADGPDRWSEGIARLLDDPRYAARLVHQARQDCETAFGFEGAKTRLLRVFTELSAANRAASLPR
jgi:glycosyltransferase involved in cell wall biosynthesis